MRFNLKKDNSLFHLTNRHFGQCVFSDIYWVRMSLLQYFSGSILSFIFYRTDKLSAWRRRTKTSTTTRPRTSRNPEAMSALGENLGWKSVNAWLEFVFQLWKFDQWVGVWFGEKGTEQPTSPFRVLSAVLNNKAIKILELSIWCAIVLESQIM